MTASVDFLPIWKKGSTAEEWLQEVAAIARKKPEKFAKVVIVAEETRPDGCTSYDYYCRNTSTTEVLGMLELGKDAVLNATSKK